MTINELRALTGLSRQEFAEKYHVTERSLKKWEESQRGCPAYMLEILEFRIKKELGIKDQK